MRLLSFLVIWVVFQVALQASEQADARIHRVSLPGQVALLGYYNTTPESPDGTRIAYVIQNTIVRPYHMGITMPGSIWICDRNLTNHRKLRDLNAVSSHNGASVLWVDDSRIAFNDDGLIYIIDAGSGGVLHGPYEGQIGHNTADHHILMSVAKDNPYGPSGSYEINTISGAVRLLRSDISHAAYQDEFPAGYNPDATTWKSLHLQYSPSGSHISYRFDCAHKSFVGNDRQELYKLVYTMNRDGSDPILFGPKPMHFSWFDDDSIAGHDNQIDDGLPNDKSVRRWDRHGNFIETLAGHGNHLSFSPDRKLYATESWYGTVPVVLRAYRRGQTTPVQRHVVSRDNQGTWDLSYHVNPSFSRDGRRVYFNHSPAPGIIEASYIEISPLAVAKDEILFADDFEAWTVGQPVTDSGIDPKRWKSDGDPFDVIERDTGNIFGRGTDNRFMRLGNVSSGSSLAGGYLDIEQRNYDKGDGVPTGILRVSFDLFEPSSGSGRGVATDLSQPAFLRLHGDKTGTNLHTIRIDDGQLFEDREGGAVLHTFGEDSAVRFDFIFNQSGVDVSFRGKVLHPGKFDVYANNAVVARNILTGRNHTSDRIERIYFRTEYPADGNSAQELWIDNWETAAVPNSTEDYSWVDAGPRFGWTYTPSAPWFFSMQSGWLYQADGGDTHFYYFDRLKGNSPGWIYMPRETYPFAYSYNLGAWFEIPVLDQLK